MRNVLGEHASRSNKSDSESPKMYTSTSPSPILRNTSLFLFTPPPKSYASAAFHPSSHNSATSALAAQPTYARFRQPCRFIR